MVNLWGIEERGYKSFYLINNLLVRSFCLSKRSLRVLFFLTWVDWGGGCCKIILVCFLIVFVGGYLVFAKVRVFLIL